ncbi:hypothetical protein GcM3_200048 [Golovinomyces cichoracearum]|uniref:Abc transporter protein n=1 Tax=Golovinomyces cichoracearum TaxID=62708 RepID=A0A420HDS9_9PEZI|nr:hypothetical protein GcM3_200048 [Golovinomyces cichoracearum]
MKKFSPLLHEARYRDDPPEENEDFYQDERLPLRNVKKGDFTGSEQDHLVGEQSWRCPPPDPAWSTHNLAHSEVYTRFPSYSNDTDALYALINEQSSYPPVYYVQIHGKHNETQRDSEAKESQQEITDFYFRINITHLLGPSGSGELQFLPNNKRGYRGTRYPALMPVLSEMESRDALYEWCQKYVSDPSRIKSFTFSRKIRNHDKQKLYRLIRTGIVETGYRGQIYITFPATHQKLIVYSPGKINELRTMTWVRWIFYLSFLWILAWPILTIVTSHYKTVVTIFYYANSALSSDPNRTCKVLSEDQWYQSWKRSIQKAVLSGINISDDALTEDYRIATEKVYRATKEVQSDKKFSDEVSNSHNQGSSVRRDLDVSEWGADC